MNFLKRFYPILLILLVFIVWKFRQNSNPALNEVSFTGTTMGTIGYSVKYFSEDSTDYSVEIDSLLKVWNMSLSTYIPESEISRFNNGTDCFKFESEYFLPVLEASREVYQNSHGTFDPTIGPLVNAWGFGPEKSMVPDSSKVMELKELVGFDKISFDKQQVCKDNPGIRLDFSAIAKGYAVDVVAEFLESNGIQNLLVEIGGELICKGTKNERQPWRTAIEDPTVGQYQRKILKVIQMKNMAVATSGNYRNYYVKDSVKYVHTIDPTTGFPIIHKLLSASVFADNCMIADAYATAFMVLGVQKSIEVLNRNPDIDAFLVYSGDDGEVKTYITERVKSYIEKEDAQN